MSKLSNIILWVAIAVVVIILIVIVGGETKTPTTEGEKIKIGIATILSGDFALLGENVVDTAKLAIKEINDKGGIDSRQLELVVEDAKVSSKDGLTAVQKLVNVDGVKYIIGGTSSNGTLASAPVVNENKVIYMTPVTGGSNVDEAGKYVFRLANSDILAGRDIASKMLDLNYKKVASLAELTEYTIDIQKSFDETIKDLEGELLFSESFQPNEKDFKTTISKIKALSPEALLIASQTGSSGAYFVKQAREMGLDIPVFSDFTFVANENTKSILGDLEGIYFADPAYSEEKSKVFFDKYEAEYNKKPFIPFHSAATYDSVMIISEALKNVGDDSEKVRDWIIANIKNYDGLMGTFSLDENGNSDLGFVIKMMKDGRAELVEVE